MLQCFEFRYARVEARGVRKTTFLPPQAFLRGPWNLAPVDFELSSFRKVSAKCVGIALAVSLPQLLRTALQFLGMRAVPHRLPCRPT